MCSFTRDYDLIKAKISQLDFKTNTCYPPIIQTINNLIHSEWSNSVTCQVSPTTFNTVEYINYSYIEFSIIILLLFSNKANSCISTVKANFTMGKIFLLDIYNFFLIILCTNTFFLTKTVQEIKMYIFNLIFSEI